jgi:large subunit ribosomal protein L15
LQRRLPKRGFTPLDRVEYSLVNISQLDVFETGSVIDAMSLVSMGLIKSVRFAVKILGNGDITKSFNVTANKFSQSAKDKIIAAGGSYEEIA